MGAGKGTITRRMDGVLDGLQSEFKALYDRADFERKLWAIKPGLSLADQVS